MPRLFVAIDLPPAVRDQLRALRSPLDGARWANPDQAHLTLRFVGEVDEAVTARLGGTLASVSASGGELHLEGVGCFPSRSWPRVLWVGVNPARWLMALQSEVEAAVTACGIAAESQRFTPHITLARLQRPDVSQVRQFVETHGTFTPRAFDVHRYALYSSLLQSGGAVHTRVAEYRLLETSE